MACGVWGSRVVGRNAETQDTRPEPFCLAQHHPPASVKQPRLGGRSRFRVPGGRPPPRVCPSALNPFRQRHPTTARPAEHRTSPVRWEFDSPRWFKSTNDDETRGRRRGRCNARQRGARTPTSVRRRADGPCTRTCARVDVRTHGPKTCSATEMRRRLLPVALTAAVAVLAATHMPTAAAELTLNVYNKTNSMCA